MGSIPTIARYYLTKQTNNYGTPQKRFSLGLYLLKKLRIKTTKEINDLAHGKEQSKCLTN